MRAMPCMPRTAFASWGAAADLPKVASMKIHKRKPLRAWNLENHAAWLAQQARDGLHYTGRTWWGAHTFERGAAGEFAYCWDKSPDGKTELTAYVKRHMAQGWEVVADVGWFTCWRYQILPGQPAPAIRGRDETRQMLRELATDSGKRAGAALLTVIGAAIHLHAHLSSMPRIDLLLLAMGSATVVLGGYTAVRLLGRLRFN